MKLISEEGAGVILYLHNTGDDIGACIRTRTGDACKIGTQAATRNLRTYGLGAQILASLGAKKLRLISNSPKKLVGLEGFGLEITEQIHIETTC